MGFDKEQIRHTLSTILHAQNDTAAAEILDMATVEIVFVETDLARICPAWSLEFLLRNSVPWNPCSKKIEKRIAEKLWKLGVNREGAALNRVNIYPSPVIGPGAVAVAVPTRTDENRIWKPRRVRVFFSHITRIKVETSALKAALEPFGIDGFVAHEDILPTIQWH